MRRCRRLIVILTVLLLKINHAVVAQEKIDSVSLAQIKDEGMNRSQVMEILSYLTDVYGPRLTWSPGYKRAAEWASHKLVEMGIQNAQVQGAEPLGRGWSLKRFSANVFGQQVFPLLAYPEAWSPETRERIRGDVIYLDAKTDSGLQTFRGKLKNKFVLLNDPRKLEAHFKPEASRVADSTLLKLANASPPEVAPQRGPRTPEQRARALLNYNKLMMCQEEGAAAILYISPGDGGNIFVSGAMIPTHPDTPFVRRARAYEAKAAEILPQIVVGAEHYDRLVRMLQKGERVRIEMDLAVDFTKEDSVYNVIAELPGSDLKDQLVMIGAHFDSWHGGTGATDNGTGSAVCMEAMRILETLGLKPRRTIRMGLWGGEEEGHFGSLWYVKQHFGERDTSRKIKLRNEGENFSVYFNHDNGTGKIRGMYMQGNEAVRGIFRAWFAPFKDWGASTLSLSNTGGTDHQSFDAINLPGFQFIQDEIEYDTRTHHSTMDLYDRVQEEDLKQAAVIMATFAYNAALRDDKFPRKPSPRPASALRP